MNLIANKLETSNAVEGKFSADGLTKMSSSSDSSLLLSLAKELVNSNAITDKDIKRNFTKYRKNDGIQDKALIDSDTVINNQFTELYNKVFTIVEPYRILIPIQNQTSYISSTPANDLLIKNATLFNISRQLTPE